MTCNDILLDNPIVKTKYVLYRSYFRIHLTIRADILQTNFNCWHLIFKCWKLKIINCSNSRKPSNATILNFFKILTDRILYLKLSLATETVNQISLACEILRFMKDSSRIFCFLHSRKPKKCNPVKEEKRSLLNEIRQSTMGHISYITRVLTNVIAKMSQRKQSAIFSCFDE